jgi:GNAT superfamily N-acetyltransferase
MTVRDTHVRDWVDGWTVSRGACDPVARPWGYTVHVGTPQQVGRHVLAATDDDVLEADVRSAAESTHAENTHLKVFADPARVLPWLGPEWKPYGSGDYLMTTDLDAAAAPAPTPPQGYDLHVWERGGVTRVLLTAPDGSFAARGQVAPTGASAVVDQIETAERHRRRGLGRVVMHHLHAAARTAGAGRAVLACTPEGRLLYEAVGWRTVAPLTNARHLGTAQG